jgi:tetratricopeptide (TPR) repeat protein
MVFKKLFKGKAAGSRQGLEDEAEASIEDLITLERYEEAEGRLKLLLKNDPENLHSHLKLADVYTALDRREAAADEYLFVADEYARDGFYDKGTALLTRALKLTPGEERLRLKLFAFDKAKGLEHKRHAAIEGLRHSRHAESGTGTQVLQLQRSWLALATSPLLQRMSVDWLRRYFAAAELVKLAAGETLATRGSDQPALFLVVSGTIDSSLERANGQRTPLRQFGAGQLVGEAATLERGSWPADYTVSEDALMLKLDRAGIEHCLAGNADPRGFLEALRTDANDRQIAEMVAKLEGASRS